MPGELCGNGFHLVGLPPPTNLSVAEGTKCRDVATKECQVHVEIDPWRILPGSPASKPVHGSGIVLDESDAVTQLQLKRSEGTLLPPLVKHCLGFVNSPENHKCLAGIGVVLSGRHRGMSDGPLELLQGLLRSAHLRICDAQQVGGIHAAWVDLPVQNSLGNCLLHVAGDGRIVKGSSLKIFLLREAPILQLKGPGEIILGFLAVAEAVMCSAKQVVRRAKLGVQFDSPFKKWDGFPALSGAVERKPGAVGLQSVERTGGGKVKGRIEFLERA